jgi:lysophospholipase L1-like esterase
MGINGAKFTGIHIMLSFLSSLRPTKSMMLKSVVITLWLAGDSLVCAYGEERSPRTGWGQTFGMFFQEEVLVRNEAMSGRSTKSFIDDGFFTKIIENIKPDDYLFIQFSHNDEKPEPHRRTDPNTDFRENLVKYITDTRNARAYPILCTPVERRNFDNGKIVPSHGAYPSAMREVAKLTNTPLIDITEKSTKLYEKLGEEESKKIFLHFAPNEHPNYPEGVTDNSHLHYNGALEICKLIVEGIRELDLPLAKYLIKT